MIFKNTFFYNNSITLFITMLLGCLLLFSNHSDAQELVWADSAGAAGAELDSKLAVDSSGNVYVTGSYQRTMIFGAGQLNETVLANDGTDGIYVAKYSSGGVLLWAKSAGGPQGNDQSLAIAVDSAGSVYITGFFGNFIGSGKIAIFGSGEVGETSLVSAGLSDAFIAKYTAEGTLVWAKRAGGKAQDQGVGLAVDGVGNVYVAGVFQNTASLSASQVGDSILAGNTAQDIVVSKFSVEGDLLWANRVGKTTLGGNLGLAVDDSGNVYVKGIIENRVLTEDTVTTIFTDKIVSSQFVAKYLPNGEKLWLKSTNGIFNEDGGDSGIAVDDSGNVYITGSFQREVTFGAGEKNASTLVSVDEGDIFVAKYQSNGELAWAKSAGGEATFALYSGDRGRGLDVDNSGSVYVTGFFHGTAVFGAGETEETTLVSNGFTDIFIAKYTASGELVSAQSIGSNGFDWGSSIVVDDTGSTYFTGTFAGAVTFGQGEVGETTLISVDDGDDDGSNPSNDIFVAVSRNSAPEEIQETVEIRISEGFDDAEENTVTGKVNRGSSDLELADQGRHNQLIGMRFNDLVIPQGAKITNASIQFQVDETHSGDSDLLIRGQAADDASPFTKARRNISSRKQTSSVVEWEPLPWTRVGEAGLDQQTPDITAIVQEIIDRPGWFSGNSLVLLISGSGTRTAESYNGDAAGAPLLHVEYTLEVGMDESTPVLD